MGQKRWSDVERHTYWRDGVGEIDYLLSGIDRGPALERLLPPGLPQNAAILEVGCNCGRNLQYLEGLGYTDLTGIDINPRALAFVVEETNAAVFEANLETREGWGSIPGGFDLVFTMAVLIHLFPDWVLDEVASRAAKWLIVIEDEENDSFRQVHRAFEEEFIRRGFVVRKEERYAPEVFGPGYVGRLYERVVCDR